MWEATGGEPTLYSNLRDLGKKLFVQADLWGSESAAEWHFSKIINDPNNSLAWRDENGHHPMDDAANTIMRRKLDQVMRVIRNSLAHGNIVFLDAQWGERENRSVRYIAFLSRYEETGEQRAKDETYRVVATTPDEFLRFLRLWALWLGKQSPEQDLRAAA